MPPASTQATVLTEKLGRWEIYQQSGGIQFMPINTLYQLYAMAQAGDPALEMAETFLMMPDLFGYWLTGERKCEFTDATSTQFYDGRRRAWSTGMLGSLGLPTHILPEVILPGTRLGTLLPALAEETGLGPLPVIAVASLGHGIELVERVDRHELDAAALPVNLPAAQLLGHRLHHAVGARVAIGVRVAQERAAAVEERVVDAPGIDGQ